MVDGKRGFEELARVVSVLGDPEPLLAELEAADLIEMVPVDAVAAAEVPSFSAVGAGAPATLAGAQRFASRLLIELLGPTSEALCLKIETAPDMPAFITAVKRARDVVREVKGQAAVARFIEQVEVHTPSA